MKNEQIFVCTTKYLTKPLTFLFKQPSLFANNKKEILNSSKKKHGMSSLCA